MRATSSELCRRLINRALRKQAFGQNVLAEKILSPRVVNFVVPIRRAAPIAAAGTAHGFDDVVLLAVEPSHMGSIHQVYDSFLAGADHFIGEFTVLTRQQQP